MSPIPRSLVVSLSTLISNEGELVQGGISFLKDSRLLPIFGNRITILAERNGKDVSDVQTRLEEIHFFENSGVSHERVIFCDSFESEQAFCLKHGTSDLIHTIPDAALIFHLATIFVIAKKPGAVIACPRVKTRVHALPGWNAALRHPLLFPS